MKGQPIPVVSTEELLESLGELYKAEMRSVLLTLFHKFMREDLYVSDFTEIADRYKINLTQDWLDHVVDIEDEDE